MSGTYIPYPPLSGGGGGSVSSGSSFSSLGAFDGGTTSSAGANAAAGVLYMQSANQFNPGLVNISNQTFAGSKTFVNKPFINADAYIGGGLTLDGAFGTGHVQALGFDIGSFHGTFQESTSTDNTNDFLKFGHNGYAGMSIQLGTDNTFNLGVVASSPPATPASGVKLYNDSGVLKYINTSGAVTTLSTITVSGSVSQTSSTSGQAYQIVWPGTPGISGQVLTTSSGGALYWNTPTVSSGGGGGGSSSVAGSVSLTSSTGGSAYSVSFPGAQGSSSFGIMANNGAGGLYWAPVKSPTIQTLSTASGTYTTPTNPKPIYLQIKMIGGGGGGGGSGGAAGSGGNTTFGSGSSLLLCNGGGGGAFQNGTFGPANAGSGGSTLISSPAIGYGVTGADGFTSYDGGSNAQGAFGAGSQFYPNPVGLFFRGGIGANAKANTGAGGSGGVNSVSGSSGGGGGAGGYLEAIVPNPSATYPYQIGGGGAFGISSGSGQGGTGGSGLIIVYEFYQ